jgi:uncharacterized damage-inducible protein DinB
MIRQVHTWGTSAWLVGRILDGFEGDDWRAGPMGTNPALWLLGHLVVERQMLGRVLGMELPDEGDAALFGPGAKPADLPDDLEGEVLLARFHEIHERFVEQLEGMDEDALQEPIEEEFPSSPKTRLGALQFMLLHESYHVGQLGTLRVMLGKGSWMKGM